MACFPSSAALLQLPPEARLQLYRQLSQKAFEDAANATRERERLMALGLGWHTLADALEEVMECQ